jgi:hypothetical protein
MQHALRGVVAQAGLVVHDHVPVVSLPQYGITTATVLKSAWAVLLARLTDSTVGLLCATKRVSGEPAKSLRQCERAAVRSAGVVSWRHHDSHGPQICLGGAASTPD